MPVLADCLWLHSGWTQFRIEDSIMLFSRSTDSGASWSSPVRISTRAGLPRDDNGSVEGWSGAVTSNGTLLMVVAHDSAIVLARSDDSGKSFSDSHVILQTGPLFFGIVFLDRCNGFPQIAVDQRTDTIHVTFADYSNGLLASCGSTIQQR